MKNTTTENFLLSNLRTAVWDVQIEGTPVTVEYMAEYLNGTDQVISLVQFWHLGDDTLRITAADASRKSIDEYRYFFKQKTKSSFVFSKTKFTEIETHVRRKVTTVCHSDVLYSLRGGILETQALNVAQGAFPDIPDLAPQGFGLASASPRFPLRMVNVDHSAPLGRLTATFASLGGRPRLLFARLIGDEIHERDFDLFRKSDTRVIRRTERIRNYGFTAQSFFFAPSNNHTS